jgi:hypothetical protein
MNTSKNPLDSHADDLGQVQMKLSIFTIGQITTKGNNYHTHTHKHTHAEKLQNTFWKPLSNLSLVHCMPRTAHGVPAELHTNADQKSRPNHSIHYGIHVQYFGYQKKWIDEKKKKDPSVILHQRPSGCSSLDTQ